jgi:hypothetical protein
MTLRAFALTAVALTGPFAATAPPAMAQSSIERRPVIRVPPAQAPAPRAPLSQWREKDAPKCISMGSLAGLVISKPNAIDLILRGGQFRRAKLEKGCTATDFYSGFYLKRTRDGRLCEDRDVIHSRAGGACEIEKFKTLLPPKAP